MIEINEKVLQNLKVVVADDHKWILAEWEVRHQWIHQFRCYHSKILTRTNSPEDVDLFWLKLFGIEEIVPANLCADLAKGNEAIKKMPKEILNLRSPEQSAAFSEIYLVHVKRCEDLAGEVLANFTDDERLHLLDRRTHIAHPTAGFYRMGLDSRGNLQDRYRIKYSKTEVQQILIKEFERHMVPGGNEQDTNQRSAEYYASKVSTSTLIQLESAIVETVIHLVYWGK